jgi:hypothetical protein
VWHQYQIVLLLGRIRLETYLLPRPEHPRLLRPPGRSPLHGCRPKHGLLALVVVLLVWLGHLLLAVVGLLSWGNSLPNDFVLHSRSMHDLLLVLGWLAILVVCWGRKTSCLVVLTLVLISSRLGVLMVLKGKCALGPFLSILVIECQHKCLNVNLCPWMNKVKIKSKGMFLSLSTLVLCTNILV